MSFNIFVCNAFLVLIVSYLVAGQNNEASFNSLDEEKSCNIPLSVRAKALLSGKNTCKLCQEIIKSGSCKACSKDILKSPIGLDSTLQTDPLSKLQEIGKLNLNLEDRFNLPNPSKGSSLNGEDIKERLHKLRNKIKLNPPINVRESLLDKLRERQAERKSNIRKLSLPKRNDDTKDLFLKTLAEKLKDLATSKSKSSQGRNHVSPDYSDFGKIKFKPDLHSNLLNQNHLNKFYDQLPNVLNGLDVDPKSNILPQNFYKPDQPNIFTRTNAPDSIKERVDGFLKEIKSSLDSRIAEAKESAAAHLDLFKSRMNIPQKEVEGVQRTINAETPHEDRIEKLKTVLEENRQKLENRIREIKETADAHWNRVIDFHKPDQVAMESRIASERFPFKLATTDGPKTVTIPKMNIAEKIRSLIEERNKKLESRLREVNDHNKLTKLQINHDDPLRTLIENGRKDMENRVNIARQLAEDHLSNLREILLNFNQNNHALGDMHPRSAKNNEESPETSRKKGHEVYNKVTLNINPIPSNDNGRRTAERSERISSVEDDVFDSPEIMLETPMGAKIAREMGISNYHEADNNQMDDEELQRLFQEVFRDSTDRTRDSSGHHSKSMMKSASNTDISVENNQLESILRVRNLEIPLLASFAENGDLELALDTQKLLDEHFGSQTKSINHDHRQSNDHSLLGKSRSSPKGSFVSLLNVFTDGSEKVDADSPLLCTRDGRCTPLDSPSGITRDIIRSRDDGVPHHPRKKASKPRSQPASGLAGLAQTVTHFFKNLVQDSAAVRKHLQSRWAQD